MKKIKTFFKNVFGELKKVKWPTRKEMVKYTFATVIFICLLSLFFYGITYGMAFIKSLV